MYKDMKQSRLTKFLRFLLLENLMYKAVECPYKGQCILTKIHFKFLIQVKISLN